MKLGFESISYSLPERAAASVIINIISFSWAFDLAGLSLE